MSEMGIYSSNQKLGIYSSNQKHYKPLHVPSWAPFQERSACQTVPIKILYTLFKPILKWHQLEKSQCCKFSRIQIDCKVGTWWLKKPITHNISVLVFQIVWIPRRPYTKICLTVATIASYDQEQMSKRALWSL